MNSPAVERTTCAGGTGESRGGVKRPGNGRRQSCGEDVDIVGWISEQARHTRVRWLAGSIDFVVLHHPPDVRVPPSEHIILFVSVRVRLAAASAVNQQRVFFFVFTWFRFLLGARWPFGPCLLLR